MDKLINYLLSAIPLGMTFLYGSTGEIITEKAGHLNLGIPGIMCVGAAGGCLALQLMSVNAALPGVLVVLIALLASFFCAAMMGLIYSFLTVSLHANQNVTGLALTTFGVGTMKFIMSKITVMAAETETRYLYAIKYFRFPFADSTTFKYCGIMVFLAIAIAIVTSYVLNRTRVGLHLRAVGENPATADAMGINVTAYKYVATLIGSGIAGLGGLFYVMDYAGSQEAYLGISALGWLSIALVIFTLWKPVVSIFGSALFGMLYVAGAYIPSIKALHVSMKATPILDMLPYIVTIIVLVITSATKKKENQPPAALGTNYYREDR